MSRRGNALRNVSWSREEEGTIDRETIMPRNFIGEPYVLPPDRSGPLRTCPRSFLLREIYFVRSELAKMYKADCIYSRVRRSLRVTQFFFSSRRHLSLREILNLSRDLSLVLRISRRGERESSFAILFSPDNILPAKRRVSSRVVVDLSHH